MARGGTPVNLKRQSAVDPTGLTPEDSTKTRPRAWPLGPSCAQCGAVGARARLFVPRKVDIGISRVPV